MRPRGLALVALTWRPQEGIYSKLLLKCKDFLMFLKGMQLGLQLTPRGLAMCLQMQRPRWLEYIPSDLQPPGLQAYTSHTACSLEAATSSLQLPACSLQPASCNLQASRPADYSLQRLACSQPPAYSQVQTCRLLPPDCSLQSA